MSLANKAKYLFYLGILPYFILYFSIQSLITVHKFNFLTDIDTAIPFVPEFIWIYHTLFPAIILVCIFVIEKKDLYWTALLSYVSAIGILATFYVVFPSFYPRHELIVGNWSEWLVYLTWEIDGAHNTFPSSHVTFSWLLFYFFSDSSMAAKKSWTVVALFCWAFLVTLSTLFLKQHYILDVLSGIILATCCYKVSNHLPVQRYAT